MRQPCFGIIPLGLMLICMLPLRAWATSAMTCHCFNERSFEPARPAAADPYFLATTQNTFFALVFAVDKKDIVMKKQRGASSDDLWIAYGVASKTGASPDNLLQVKQNYTTWKEALASQRLPLKGLGQRFSYALNGTSSAARLAETVVDELFLRYRLLSDAELAELRKAGASNQELIIAMLISSKTGQPVKKIHREVKSGSTTWGALLQRAQVDPKNLQREFAPILKLRPQ